MKYEMVFGNYEFAGSTSEIAVRSGYGDILEMSLIAPIVIPDEWSVIAMRRIIQEPKHWTVEDQKAGRLPKVGCMVMVTSVDECASVAAINNDAVCVVYHDGEFTTLHKSGISPIETPEEKAQRLRSEWIKKAYVDYKRLGCELEILQLDQIGNIYDALLSGELQAPTKGE